ncbi:acetylpolyamine aminohydrolase [Collibacillus ludicampi]|uniref:Acetylpolyamine aminohydrolase n=1 Tax=Collibacillus ludicampi TaxID=2771369 RepID=A0AAV4LAC5_9BACL|nr:class II histone deacetylase [Collibacillus ludicampi]GIM44732.1 acetylpolyamine aminohydrolase [Collibacillus ludicampi]
MRKTGFVCDESYFWHDTGNGALFLPPGGWVETDVHSENPATKRRFKNLLERSGLMAKLVQIAPRPATREEIQLYHTPDYVEKVKHLSDTTGGDAGELALVGSGSYEIAVLSTGGAITAVDAVMKGQVDNAYALTRPPGHHAEKSLGMGFCLFNNVAIAAKYAQKTYNLERILVLDWDVHHGNGTESAFYDNPNVLFISLHQELNYPPGRGLAEHVGEGRGEGYNVNIPLPAGTGNAGYMYALETLVRPIADQFKPQLILISAGQDPSLFDPLARMMVTAEGFRRIASFMLELADTHCNGRLVACHEGGYSAPYVPFCSHAIVEEMSGIRTAVEDPFAPAMHTIPTDVLYDIQKEYVDRVKEVQSKYWKMS